METTTLQIIGMHCTSCAINIDFELEDVEGVIESQTDYVKQKTVVTYEPDAVTSDQMIDVIHKLGYEARVAKPN